MMLAEHAHARDPFAGFFVAALPRPHPGERVEVYRNLHHGKGPVHYWSIREAGKPRHVLAVAAFVQIRDARFHVTMSTWERVVETRKREVHAWAVGDVVAWDEHRAPARPRGLVRVTYNPFRANFFHMADPNHPQHPEQLTRVDDASLMWFDREGLWVRQ